MEAASLFFSMQYFILQRRIITPCDQIFALISVLLLKAYAILLVLLYQHSVTMIHLMLYDLRRPDCVDFDTGL